jgi:hypothetical protein
MSTKDETTVEDEWNAALAAFYVKTRRYKNSLFVSKKAQSRAWHEKTRERIGNCW